MANRASMLNKLFIYLLIFTFVLPSGRFGLFVAIPTAAILLINSIKNKNHPFKINTLDSEIKLQLLIDVSLLILISVYIIKSLILQYSDLLSIVNMFSQVVALFLVINILWGVSRYEVIDLDVLKKALYIAMFLGLFSKIFFQFYFLFNEYRFSEIVIFYRNVFHSSVMTMRIGLSPLVRIQTPNDPFVLTMVSFFLIDRQVKNVYKVIVIPLSAFYFLLVYSRVYLFQYALMALVTLGVWFFYSPNRNRLYKYYIAGLGLVVSMLTVGRTVTKIVYDYFFGTRFAGQETGGAAGAAEISDQIRLNQGEVLWYNVQNRLFFGHGFASYISDFLRNPTSRFQYELEYLALIFQFGIVGFSIFMGLMLFKIIKMIPWKHLYSREIIVIVFNLLIWLMRPFFNPAILSTHSASVVGTVVFFGLYYHKKYEGRD